MHALWLDYAGGVLGGGCGGGGGPAAAAEERAKRLAGLDLHGARLRVLSSPRPADVGTAGIVLRDGGRALRMLGADGRARQVLKRGTELDTVVGGLHLRIRGSGLLAPPNSAAPPRPPAP